MTNPRNPFADNVVYFDANVTALEARWRRPGDGRFEAAGPLALSAIGGLHRNLCSKPVSLADGSLNAESFITEVSGDYADLALAKTYTEGPDNGPNRWSENRIPARTRVLCAINGFEAINFTDRATKTGPRLRIGRMEFVLEGEDRRTGAESSFNFSSLYFLDVSVNGRTLNVEVDLQLVNGNPTHGSLVAAAKSGGRAHPAANPNKQVVTVVRSLSWADGAADSNIQGHSVYIPNFGVIYFGEVVSSLNHRRIQMVRVAAGSGEGGELLGGGGGGNGHGIP